MESDPTEYDDLESYYDLLEQPLSILARCLFSYLERRGGSVRIAPLLRDSGLDADQIAAAGNELARRRMITIIWRTPRVRLPDGLPERFRACERLCTTRWGRHRYAITWPTR